jgi:hypothetical protein
MQPSVARNDEAVGCYANLYLYSNLPKHKCGDRLGYLLKTARHIIKKPNYCLF